MKKIMVNSSTEYNMEKTGRIHLSPRQKERFYRFLIGDDLDFYEEYVIYETPEEQERFFADNPDFMSEYPVSHERIGVLRDKMFRNILRMIKQYESDKESNKKAPT